MIRKLLFALAVLLTAGLASAQPNRPYSFARDKEGVPIIGRGLRPVVTAEMGIPPGTPFYDTSTFSLYYWSGDTWTLSAPASGGATFSSPVLLASGTASVPALAFAADPDTGLNVTNGDQLQFIAGASNPVVLLGSQLRFASTTAVSWSSGAADTIAGDAFIYRDSAAAIQMGADAASAVSQTFKGSDSTGNGTAGGVLTIRGGAGTAGDAKGGNLNLAGGAAFGAGEQGVVAIVDTGTKPTCAAGLRGGLWYEQGGAGVADTFEICAKQAAGDTYAWRTAATIP